MSVIQLGKKVIISDPSYEIPSVGQVIVTNVRHGQFCTYCKKYDTADWGIRPSMLFAIHRDYINVDLTWKHKGTIFVDSGQAGIFNLSTYRDDNEDVPLGKADISFLNLFPQEKEGDKWYTKICSHTLGEVGWGHYNNGVVSRSGFGDGGYEAFVGKVDGKVVGFAIDFAVEEEPIIDFNWYKGQLVFGSKN